MIDNPARELASHIAGMVERIEKNIPSMVSSASFNSKDATMEDQLYSYFAHFDEAKLKVILILMKI